VVKTAAMRGCRRPAAWAVALLAGLAVIAPVALSTEVYRWVDTDGKVHFGDRPPIGRPAEQIEIRPPMGALPLPDAEEILRRPVRPEGQPEPGTEPPEDIEIEPEPEPEPQEYIRDRRSFRGR
jgi:hypothetical protein